MIYIPTSGRYASCAEDKLLMFYSHWCQPYAMLTCISDLFIKNCFRRLYFWTIFAIKANFSWQNWYYIFQANFNRNVFSFNSCDALLLLIKCKFTSHLGTPAFGADPISPCSGRTFSVLRQTHTMLTRISDLIVKKCFIRLYFLTIIAVKAKFSRRNGSYIFQATFIRNIFPFNSRDTLLFSPSVRGTDFWAFFV